MKLGALRVNAGLKQIEAARLLGVTSKTLRNWEQYRTAPDAPKLYEMCELYGCSIDDIFFPQLS